MKGKDMVNNHMQPLVLLVFCVATSHLHGALELLLTVFVILDLIKFEINHLPMRL